MANNKAGRVPLPAERQRTSRLSVLATEGEKAAFEGRARDCGLSVSAWLRFIASNAIVREAKWAADHAPSSHGRAMPGSCINCGGEKGPICSEACAANWCEREGAEQIGDGEIVADAGKRALAQQQGAK